MEVIHEFYEIMNLELVLKMPKGKAPFIGILFEIERDGAKLHAEVMERYQNEAYEVVMEHTQRVLNLRLICKEKVLVCFYNHLKVDTAKLNSWLYLTKDCKAFTFGHIIRELDRERLVLSHPSRKKFFVKVSSCKLVRVEDEEDGSLPFTVSGMKWD